MYGNSKFNNTKGFAKKRVLRQDAITQSVRLSWFYEFLWTRMREIIEIHNLVITSRSVVLRSTGDRGSILPHKSFLTTLCNRYADA